MTEALVIEHRTGTTVTIHSSRKNAVDALAAFVEQFWIDEIGEDVEIPSDRDERINEYFEAVTDEFYVVTEVADGIPAGADSQNLHATTIFMNGDDAEVTVHATEEEALDALCAFVDDWWNDEVGSDVEPPEDRDERINEYFNVAFDAYNIQPVCLED